MSDSVPYSEGFLQQQEEEKRTFITNWLDRVDDILQLFMSDAIWQARGENPENPVNIQTNKRILGVNETLTEYYVDRKLYFVFHTYHGEEGSDREPFWKIRPVKENKNEQIRGKQVGKSALW